MLKNQHTSKRWNLKLIKVEDKTVIHLQESGAACFHQQNVPQNQQTMTTYEKKRASSTTAILSL